MAANLPRAGPADHPRPEALDADRHLRQHDQRATAPRPQEAAMSRDTRTIFADIDAFDPDRFVAHLTEDAVFRFGNGEPVIGRAAVREAVAGFFSTIDGLSHHIL